MKRFYVWWAALVFTAAGARAQFIDVAVSSGAALEASGHRSKPVPGQSLTPKPSAEGNEALDKLLERCQAEGGVKEVRDAESQAVSYALADAEKVKVTVVANRQLLTSALRDAAFARWNTAFRVPARRQRSTGLFGFAETLSSMFSIGDTPIRRIDEGQQRLGFVLLRAIGEATGDDRALAFATFLAGQAEVRRGDYTEALRDYEQAGQLFVTAKDPAWEAGCINRLGWVYAEQGEYLRAQENLLRAKDRAEKALGRDHPLVADCQENLGEIYARQKDYAKAEEYLRQAISIRSKAPGEHRPNVATDRVALGDAYARQGNTDEARAQFERRWPSGTNSSTRTRSASQITSTTSRSTIILPILATWTRPWKTSRHWPPSTRSTATTSHRSPPSWTKSGTSTSGRSSMTTRWTNTGGPWMPGARSAATTTPASPSASTTSGPSTAARRRMPRRGKKCGRPCSRLVRHRGRRRRPWTGWRPATSARSR